MNIILGQPGNGKANGIQLFIAFVGALLETFATIMAMYTLNNDFENNIRYSFDNSLDFLKFALQHMSSIYYIIFIISTFLFFILTLRFTVWKSEDDRLIF